MVPSPPAPTVPAAARRARRSRRTARSACGISSQGRARRCDVAVRDDARDQRHWQHVGERVHLSAAKGAGRQRRPRVRRGSSSTPTAPASGAPGSHKSERATAREPCFNGASCGRWQRVRARGLPLDDGWWRLSPSSKVAYRCPLYGTRFELDGAAASPRGLPPGHRPLCAACEAVEHVQWDLRAGTEEVRGRSIAVIVVFFLVVAVAVAVAAAWKVRTMLKQSRPTAMAHPATKRRARA